MAQSVGVVIIHGMGSQKMDFAVPMVERLEKEIRKRGANPDRIAFQPIFWAPILQEKEQKLLDVMTSEDRLDWMQLRSFVVNNLADAIAYQKTAMYMPDSREEVPVYPAIHDVVAGEMHHLAKKVSAGSPLVVIAHSLGCHIMSNYIWDASHPPNPVIDSANPFETFQTLATIATFGCNLPLFLLANHIIEPIRFPGAKVAGAFPGATPKQLKEVTTWTNYFDRDDILAWPLQPLSEAYRKIVTDVQVNAGGLLSWTPKSHTAYWTDADVIKPIAATLTKILKLL